MKKSDTDFVVFDLETTGLSPLRGARVIEIGAVKIEDGEITDKFQSLVNPRITIPAFLSGINGITDAMLEDQPKSEEIFPQFQKFINSAILVAHNAKFDMSFLRAELAHLELDLMNRYQCTLQMSRQRFPELSNYRLETVANYVLGTIPENLTLHRALGDAQLTALVWLEMMKRDGD